MEVAAEVLAASGSSASAGRSVRATGIRPWAQRVPEDGLADAVAEAAAALDEEEGTLAVVVPRARLDAVTDAVAARIPSTSADLTAGPVVLPPEGAKGLEFDSVLVVDPVGIVDRRGAGAQRPVRRPHPRHPAAGRRPPRRAPAGAGRARDPAPLSPFPPATRGPLMRGTAS